MKLSISSYMSPWESVDYSLKFEICICGKWKQSTILSPEPFDLKNFAEQMANLSPMSGEIILDLSSLLEDPTFELKISPHQSGEIAIVDIYTLYIYDDEDVVHSEMESLREAVPIQKINKVGREILAAIRDDGVFEYRSEAEVRDPFLDILLSIATPKEVEEEPSRYEASFRDTLLDVEYETNGKTWHIFWIGIVESTGQLYIGTADSKNLDDQKIYLLSKFLREVIQPPEKVTWKGIARPQFANPFENSLFQIATPQRVELEPEKYVDAFRETLLHREYIKSNGKDCRIFWIGIVSGQLRIGICDSKSNEERNFYLLSTFLRAIEEHPNKVTWKEIVPVDKSKTKRKNYDLDAEDMRSICDACEPDGYLGDGVYLWGPNAD